MRRLFITFFILVIIGFSCQKTPENPYPDEPQIYYNGVSQTHKNIFDSANVVIRLGFNDGTGDIGVKEVDSCITLTEYRSGIVFRSFQYGFPRISKEYRIDPWIEGTIDISLQPAFFTPRLDSLHLAEGKDTLYYEIFLKDEAGNKSNIVATDTIYISAE